LLGNLLLQLGKALATRLVPADRTARELWLQGRGRVINPDGLETTEAVSKVALVYGRLNEQFAFPTAYLVANNFLTIIQSLTVEKSSPWQPPDGRQVPEIDPQDIHTLLWAAEKLLRASGWAPAAQEKVDERWLSASEACKLAKARGFDITLDWVSKRKDRIRTRPPQLPGRHQLEVEMGSLVAVLFAEAKPRAPSGDTDEPGEAEREEIEARTRAEQARKDRARS
jgi:hypothetical protein